MTLLEQPLENFKKNLSKVDQLTRIGSDVGNLTVDLLENLLVQYETMPAFLEFKSKLKRDIDMIKKIKDHPSLKDKYLAIYQQSLILVVSNFESFLNEISTVAFNEYSHMVNWPDQKVSLDLSVFKYSAQTVGEIVLRSIKEKYNFQDLQSTIKFFKDYFDVNLIIETELKNQIVLYHAKRHALVHNLGKVDDRFLKQIREVENALLQYSKDDNIVVSESDYLNVKKIFVIFSEKISSGMNEKKLPF